MVQVLAGLQASLAEIVSSRPPLLQAGNFRIKAVSEAGKVTSKFICLSVRPSVSQSIYPSVRVSVHPSIHLVFLADSHCSGS